MQYEIVTTVADLDNLLNEIGDGVAALDFETTSFTPDTGVVRSAQICNDTVWAVIDFFAIGADLNWQTVAASQGPVGELPPKEAGFRRVAHWFGDAAWIVFNAGFEQSWFMQATDEPITCWDVGYLKRSVQGGGHMSLMSTVLEDLEHEMSKEEQASDWGAAELTKSQLDYAADDAFWTWALWKYWRERSDAGHMACFNMFNDLVPPVHEMQTTGLLLHKERHAELVHKWEGMRADRLDVVRSFITESEIENLNSGAQISDYFMRLMPDDWLAIWPRTEKTGLLSTANKDLLKIAALAGPGALQDALITLTEYRTVTKYISSFGDSLITIAKHDPLGRIHARFNIAAARTGRFSCSGPNLQQVPKDRDFYGEFLSVRQSFIAAAGLELVSLDYSGIELRVLALLSGDEQLLYDVTHGDVHLETAMLWQGRKLDRKKPEDNAWRAKAKGINFGIIYGIQAPGLSVTMRSSIDDAQDMLNMWADRYPKAFQLRADAMTEAEATHYLRMVDGGTVFMGKKPSPTRCANYPVQRAALTIMARAIIRHHESLVDFRDQGGEAWMASTIHDALIDEANDGDAPAVLELMRDDMTQAYLDVFPDAPLERLLEGGTGPSWGELTEEEM